MTNNILRLWKSMESDDPFDPFFRAAPVMMHSIDVKGLLLNVSQFWADKLGYEPIEMIGRKSTDFLTKQSQRQAAEITLPEFFRTGQTTNVEYDFIRKDGKILPVLMSAIAQYNEDGEFVRSLAVMFDNTETKRAVADLLKQQRLDAIGELVGGVAHDFNNLLAVIQGNLEFLQMDPDDPERWDFIENALNAARRGGSLTQQLLSFGRKARLTPDLIDLNETVANIDRMVRRLLPTTIQLETVSGGGLWQAKIDPALLETAILNLLNNARDSMPEGGRITIETHNTRIDEDYIEHREESIQPGRYVMLAISDTGCGMDETSLSRAFEPFFTTKPVGKGSGMGLAMVFGFMRQSNGTIRVYSEVGVGTTFKMYFPAISTDLEKRNQRHINLEMSGLGQIVLLAEDEDQVRRVMAKQLPRNNYRVVQCATGDMAFRKMKEGLVPDLIVTDIVMPGSLQGPELVTKARTLLPDLPALYVSGYPTEAAIHGNGMRPTDEHLIKPVGEAQLLKVITKIMKDR